MKADLVVSGVIGLLVGVAALMIASWVKSFVPPLIQGRLGATIAFGILLAIALIEMPLMVFGLRQMARESQTPRTLVIGTFALYTSFASVYASAFVLATGEVVMGIILAVLTVPRLISGIWVK